MKTTPINEIRDAVIDSFEQSAIHASAIDFRVIPYPEYDRFSVTYGDSDAYELTGKICDKYYEVTDNNTQESIRFYTDHIETFPHHRFDDGNAKFDSYQLSCLDDDFITMIDTPEYDLYGQIWEKHEDGSYYLTEEAVAEQERREREQQLRNSRPPIPTNAEIGIGLINQLLTSDLYQTMLSAKHLLPAEKRDEFFRKLKEARK